MLLRQWGLQSHATCQVLIKGRGTTTTRTSDVNLGHQGLLAAVDDKVTPLWEGMWREESVPAHQRLRAIPSKPHPKGQ